MNVGTIALPTGPFDWHPECIPATVYEQRIAGVRAAMSERGLTHAVLHGNVFDHAGLTWLTGFTPKLGPAYALVPVNGLPRILFSGGPGMKPSAERLTWVGDVNALRGIGRDLAAWLKSSSATGGRVGLYEGSSMALGDWSAVGKAAGTIPEGLDAPIDAMRRAKTDLDLALMRQSCSALDGMAQTLLAKLQTQTGRTAALAAEAAAYGLGAQDARIRIGRSAWAPPQSIDDLRDKTNGPLRIAVATRANGYWATAEFVSAPLPSEIAERAATVLGRAIAALRPGASLADVCDAAGTEATITVDGIGLSPCELPHLANPEMRLASRDVCSMTLGLPVGHGATARWSVIAAIGDTSPELLWRPPGFDLP